MPPEKHQFRSENERLAHTPQARLADILLKSAALHLLNDTTTPEYTAAYTLYHQRCLKLTTDLGLAEEFILTKEPGEEFDRESAQKPNKPLMGSPYWFGVIAQHATRPQRYTMLK